MAHSPKEVALDWFEEVWNRGSEAAIDRLMAVDAPFHGLPTPDGRPLVGPGDVKPMVRQFRSAFPDIRIDVERSVVEGNFVAVHCRVTATHCGPELGCSPTNRPVVIEGMGIAHVRDGKIVEAWNAFDFMSLYQQVGMLPALAPVPAAATPSPH